MIQQTLTSCFVADPRKGECKDFSARNFWFSFVVPPAHILLARKRREEAKATQEGDVERYFGEEGRPGFYDDDGRILEGSEVGLLESRAGNGATREA